MWRLTERAGKLRMKNRLQRREQGKVGWRELGTTGKRRVQKKGVTGRGRGDRGRPSGRRSAHKKQQWGGGGELAKRSMRKAAGRKGEAGMRNLAEKGGVGEVV